MNLNGIPVPLRYVHRLFFDCLVRWSLIARRRRRPRAGLHLVYFSYANDFDYLSLSLRSLNALGPIGIKTVTIVEDIRLPFDADMKQALLSINGRIKFKQLGKIDWSSRDTLATELNAFRQAAEEAEPYDFIVKVDSDLLFYGANAISRICASNYDFVGDGHYSQYDYAQGGLYFVRARTLKSILPASESLTVSLIHSLSHVDGFPAEDRVVSALIKKSGARMWLTSLMLFPDEFRASSLESAVVRNLFCSLHFVRCKQDMKFYFDLTHTSSAGAPE